MKPATTKNLLIQIHLTHWKLMIMEMVKQKMKAIVTTTILRSIPTPLKPVMASITIALETS